jgi:hypothetical protein
VAGSLQSLAAMFVFRSLVVGLLGACFVLLVRRPPCELRIEPTRSPSASRVRVRPTRGLPIIIDIASGVPASALAALVHLGPGEHVIAVDDQTVSGDLEAGSLIAARASYPGTFIDLSVAGPAGERRVLVLLH